MYSYACNKYINSSSNVVRNKWRSYEGGNPMLGGDLKKKRGFDALHIACEAYHDVNIVLT
jgi:hypothetical protein